MLGSLYTNINMLDFVVVALVIFSTGTCTISFRTKIREAL